jgi:CRISPR-associated protein Cas1
MELILNTFGVSLSRDADGFLISSTDTRQRIPADAVTSIQISRGAQITSDAVMLAIEHEIGIMFMDKSGNPIGRVWSPRYGSVSSIRKGQLNFTFSSEAITWIKSIISRKISNQQALLLMMKSHDQATKAVTDKAITRLDDYITKISIIEGEIVADVAPQLRGWEGIASKIYFETLNLFIPEKYRFNERSQCPATDVTNALLNYGYGILYGRIEGALIKAGIDPYIGVMHRDDYNRPVLVYDVIEIYRIWVDFVVYSLVAQNVVSGDYFSMRDDGSCWLEALGRRVLIQSFNDYLSEIITVGAASRSRLSQIQLYAQQLAQMFKKFQQ